MANGYLFHTSNQLEEAEETFKFAFELSIKINSAHVIKILNAIGNIYLAQGKERSDDAIKTFKKSLEYLDKTKCEEDFLREVTTNSLRKAYQLNGDYKQAINYLKQVLDGKIKLYGHGNIPAAAAYHAIGHMHQMNCKDDRAIEQYREALKIKNSLLSNARLEFPELPIESREVSEDNIRIYIGAIIVTREGIGNAFYNSGKHKEALTEYTNSLSLRNKYNQLLKDKKSENLEMATTINLVANTYRARGDYKTAIDNYKESLSRKQSLLDFYVIHQAIECTYNSLWKMKMLYGEDFPFSNRAIRKEISQEPSIIVQIKLSDNEYQISGRHQERLLRDEELLQIREMSDSDRKESYVKLIKETEKNIITVYKHIDWNAEKFFGLSEYSRLLKTAQIKTLLSMAITYNWMALTYESTKEYKLAITYYDNALEARREYYEPIHIALQSIQQRMFNILPKIKNTLDIDFLWMLKKIIYRNDVKEFESILNKYNIESNIDILKYTRDFRYLVLLKVHPDKGGENVDFQIIQEIQNKFKQDLNENFDSTIIYKAAISFKLIDTAVDAARLIYEPTLDNVKRISLDTTYIFSMYSGINGYSLYVSGADILYKAYEGEYILAMQQFVTISVHMALPTMLQFTSIPYIGVIYSASMVFYTGYVAITNLYSFYLEYNSIELELKTGAAYRDLFNSLSISPLQQFCDFATASKKYEVRINTIKLEQEKVQTQQQLEEAKGEFGQKLYDYAYAPYIEEKYDLLNKVILGYLTEEQAEVLKAKHIQIMDYDRCIEVIYLKAEQSNHYYCYNEEQQILDHVVIIGEVYVENISSIYS